jgi:hypothetical protein
MTKNIPPHPNTLPPRGRGSEEGNIYPSAYYIAKKRSFYNILIKKFEKF